MENKDNTNPAECQIYLNTSVEPLIFGKDRNFPQTNNSYFDELRWGPLFFGKLR